MSVELNPPTQLGFPRPLTQLVKRILAVTNHNSHPVAFKVKTTAPKNYCVRPNSGRIEPGETVEVQVLLQPMKDDPAPGSKCRDKFLVQSAAITAERESVPVSDLWAKIEKDDKKAIHEQKIRCTYLPPPEGFQSTPPRQPQDGASTPPAHTTNGAAVPLTPSSSASTPASTPAAQPQPHDDEPEHEPDQPASPTQAKFENATSTIKDTVAAVLPASLTGLSPINSQNSRAEPQTTTTTTVKADTEKELARKLSAASDEIVRLKAQLAAAEETTLRLRKTAPASSSSAGSEGKVAVAHHQGKAAEGVPVQIVAGIAVAVFVVTWLFF